MRPGIVLLTLVTVATSSAAQASGGRGGCFRGAPADRCAWFALAEAGAYYRFSDVIPGDERVLVNYTLGFMVNSSPRTAIGGEAFGGAEGELRGGLALRWRRWLTGNASIDAAAGIHLLGEASAGTVRAGSPMIQARYTYRDLVGAAVRLDALRLNDACFDQACATLADGTSTRFYIGGEVGSGAGVAAMVATGLLVLLAAAAYGS